MNRIRKFTEAVDNISSEKVDEIIDDIKDYSKDIERVKGQLEGISEFLSKYRSDSGNSNDQIDNSVSNLEIVIEKITTAVDLLDTIHTDLVDYDNNGRKYLY